MSQMRNNAGMRPGAGNMQSMQQIPKQQTPGLLLLNPAAQQQAINSQQMASKLMQQQQGMTRTQPHPHMMMGHPSLPQQPHHMAPSTMQYQPNLPVMSQPVLQANMPVSTAQSGLTTAPIMASAPDHEASILSANMKEKTPMCLINELARHNKVSHQYTLTDEQGPAHKKIFYVKLKLGDEEYTAEGPSIKKAQHAAAQIALENTQLKHPPPKMNRHGTNSNLTPTVELNSLAMKRGEPAVYKPIEPHRPMQYNQPISMDFRGMYNQRICYVSLKVGQREFIGEGATRQAARHSAATKALNILRKLPLPQSAMPTLLPEKPVLPAETPKSDGNTELKSEISLVHEIALKANMPVNFKVVRESGPPHMRCFVTQCSVGEITTEGEGNGKKISKKRAAEKMLEELKRLPGLPATESTKPKVKAQSKKKNRNLIKMQKTVADYGVGINPISRLIQIQQAKKEKEPVYTLLQERGLPRRREFVIQVSVGSHQCQGVGPNKKLAKRSAAEAMLQLLGYSQRLPEAGKPTLKQGHTDSASDKKVKFVDQDPGVTSCADGLGRQLVPGVLLMPDGSRLGGGAQDFPTNQQPGLQRAPGPHIGLGYSPQTTATIAKELLNNGSSPTAEALSKSAPKPVSQQQASVIRPKQQLLYLADVLGFQVQFTDFPKGSNKSEFLSLVSLSTNPPQVSHGAGATIDASHDAAALTALKSLSDIGVDAITKKPDKKPIIGGDGRVSVGRAGEPGGGRDGSSKSKARSPPAATKSEP